MLKDVCYKTFVGKAKIKPFESPPTSSVHAKPPNNPTTSYQPLTFPYLFSFNFKLSSFMLVKFKIQHIPFFSKKHVTSNLIILVQTATRTLQGTIFLNLLL
jgi:hypothetical protein